METIAEGRNGRVIISKETPTVIIGERINPNFFSFYRKKEAAGSVVVSRRSAEGNPVSDNAEPEGFPPGMVKRRIL